MNQAPMTKRQILIAARKTLVDSGWCQECYISGSGACCMVGAVLMVCNVPSAARDGALNALQSALLGESPIGFNDEPGRTLEQVLLVYDVAISASESA